MLRCVLHQPRFMLNQSRIFARNITKGAGGITFTTKMTPTTAPGCPPLSHSDRTLIGQRDEEEMKNFLDDLKNNTTNLFKHASWRGEPKENFKFAMREVNAALRASYASLMTDVGIKILPMVVMNDADPGELGTGTSVTLYDEDGQTHRYVPTNKDYEYYKDLSHMMFGIFSYVGPYMRSPKSTGWIGPLKNFQGKVQSALFASKISNLPADAAERAYKMLTLTNDYMNSCIEKKECTKEGFQEYCKKMMPFVEETMRQAVHYQTEALIPLMEDIKKKLGSKWDDTYFILPTVWPASGINTRIQVLETVMSERHLRTHLITVENVHSHEEARNTLGRVVGDRALAQVAFGNETPEMQKHIYALSSPQDLMSDYTDEEITKFQAKRGK